MAVSPVKVHTLKVGTNEYSIRLHDVYTGLGTITGITLGAPKTSAGNHTLSTAMLGGKIGRVRISYKEGGKSKSAMLAVAIDKMDTIIADLPGKSYKTFPISSASIPRKRVLR